MLIFSGWGMACVLAGNILSTNVAKNYLYHSKICIKGEKKIRSTIGIEPRAPSLSAAYEHKILKIG